MANIIPFKGLRYNNKLIKDLSTVTTPPYDIISLSEQDSFYIKDEYNAIRIELGKELLDDSPRNNRYTRAAYFMNKWIEKEVLKYEDTPSLYLYDQIFTLKNGERKVRRGIICLVELVDFSDGIILPHEETFSRAKKDRLDLISTTNTNTSQIFSLYDDKNKSVSNILSRYSENNEPDINFINYEGVHEKLWIIKDSVLISNICNSLKDSKLFIGDGHHRYETALNYKKTLISQNPNHTGKELYNYVMMTITDIDDSGLVILPIHRVIRNLESFNSNTLIESFSKEFSVDKIQLTQSQSPNFQIEDMLYKKGLKDKVLAYYDGSESCFYLLTLKNPSILKSILPDKSEAYRDLDVSILHSLILEKHLGIDNKNVEEQKNIFYSRSIEEGINFVDNNAENKCAFFLNGAKVEQIKNISLENEKMPQKSTYFYPKLITGVVMNKFK